MEKGESSWSRMKRFKLLSFVVFVFALIIGGFFLFRPAPYHLIMRDFPPYSFLENGKPTGITVEIAKEAMKRLKISNYDFKKENWTADSSASKKIFLAVAKIMAKGKPFAWAGPVATVKYSLYGKGKINLATIDAAKELSSIGVAKGDLSYDILLARDFHNLYFATSAESAFEKMAKGDIALWAGTDYELKMNAAKMRAQPTDFENAIVIGDFELYFAFGQKFSGKMIKKWQKVLDEMRRDGFLEKVTRQFEDFENKDVTREIKK